MEYKQLAYFLTVCKERSFSRAASKLYITQQGLSKSINNLEEELDVPLFFRSNIGLELTEFGEVLEKHANSYLNQHDYIKSNILQRKFQTSETLSLGFATGMFNLLPAHFLSNFMLEHKDANIKIKSFIDDECAQSILDYKINLGFCPSPVDLNFFDSLYSERRKIKLILSDSHSLAHKDSILMDDLKNETIITLNTKTGSQDILLENCLRHGFKPSIYLNAAEINLMAELCSKGLAVSFYAGRTDILPDSVKVIEIEDLNVFWEFHLISNKRTYLTSIAKEFIEYTRKRLE